MKGWPVLRRGDALRDGARGLAAAAAIACLTILAAPALSQMASPYGPAAVGDGAPVIVAPDDPGRLAPELGNPPAPEAGTLNSFATWEAEPLPLQAPTPLESPVVVELFTSQGCSSCPAADAMLAALADDPGVLPLSFHVDYWDYLGWADSFARPEFTARQEAYARAAGERSLYTPQLIVDGRDTAVAPGPAQLVSLIEGNRLAPAMLSVHRNHVEDGETIRLTPLSDLGGPVAITLVHYVPQREVKVRAGENRGRTVRYVNVVLGTDELALWDGTVPLRLKVRPGDEPDARFPDDTRHALLVQRRLRPHGLPGPILTALRLD